MGSIYGTAEVVIIWLGKAEKCTWDVIGTINHLAKVYDKDYGSRCDLRSPTALDIVESGTATPSGIPALYPAKLG